MLQTLDYISEFILLLSCLVCVAWLLLTGSLIFCMILAAQDSMPSCAAIFFFICSFYLCSFQIRHFSRCNFYSSIANLLLYVQNMSKGAQGNADGVSFRAISLMNQEEAEKLAYCLGLKADSPRRIVRQEHLIIRNGILTKLDENQLDLIASSTKIIDKFTLTHPPDDKFTSIRSQQANGSQIHQESHHILVNLNQQSDSSIIQELQDSNFDLEGDYCRIHYEKMALEKQMSFLIQQNIIKDEIINELSHRLTHRINFPIIEQQWRQDSHRVVHTNQPFFVHVQEAPHQIRREVHRGIQFNYNSITNTQAMF